MRTFQRISRFIRPAVGLPVLAGLALAGLVVLALGCGEERGAPAASAPAVNPRLPDIPVPAGFQFLDKESYESMMGGRRQVLHRYKGDAPVRQVAEFYRRNMVPLGWTVSSERFVEGKQRLVFAKGNEACHISIWDEWGTRIQIYVLPSGFRAAETDTGRSP
jgi:hypothetical protein